MTIRSSFVKIAVAVSMVAAAPVLAFAQAGPANLHLAVMGITNYTPLAVARDLGSAAADRPPATRNRAPNLTFRHAQDSVHAVWVPESAQLTHRRGLSHINLLRGGRQHSQVLGTPAHSPPPNPTPGSSAAGLFPEDRPPSSVGRRR